MASMEVSSFMKEVFSSYIGRNMQEKELSDNYTTNLLRFILNTVNMKEATGDRMKHLYKRYIGKDMSDDLSLKCEKRITENGLTYPDFLSETLISDEYKSFREKVNVLIQISDSLYASKSLEINKEQIKLLGWDFIHYMYYSRNKSFDKFIKLNPTGRYIVCIDGKYKMFTYAFVVLLIDVLTLTKYTRFTFYDKDDMFLTISKPIDGPVINFDFRLTDVSQVCVEKS